MRARASLNDEARINGPVGLKAAEILVATICDEAARRLGGAPEAGLVILEVRSTGPGWGIDYEEITLDDEACLQLRALREALAIGDHGDPERERGWVSFDVEPIASATARAHFAASRPQRLANLAALVPKARNHACGQDGQKGQAT